MGWISIEIIGHGLEELNQCLYFRKLIRLIFRKLLKSSAINDHESVKVSVLAKLVYSSLVGNIE